MTRCRELEPQLSLYVDDQLDGPSADAVRAHLNGCAHCAGLLSDLTRLAAAARRLGPIAPPGHIYVSLAEQLSSPPADRPAVAAPRWRRLRAGAAAAVLLLATGAAYLAGGRLLVSPAPPPGAFVDAHPADAAASELDLAVHHYERAIAALENDTRDTGLDPEVARVVRRSLGALDQAILESRQAAAADPANEPARISLFEALRRKIDLLQTTALIVNEYNNRPAGAPRPADGTGREL